MKCHAGYKNISECFNPVLNQVGAWSAISLLPLLDFASLYMGIGCFRLPLYSMKISYEQPLQQLAQAAGKRILVVGDLMLDKYVWGRVERISPEAPVPVVEFQREESRLGGAANVALNLKALGAQPILCGLIGDDADGEILCALLKDAGLSTDAILVDASRPTTSKTRILGNTNQMLRVDKEVITCASDFMTQSILDTCALELEQADALICQDYDKGVLHSGNISALIQKANAQGKPVFVDPKRKNFLSYGGATVFKPNLKELNEGLGLSLSKGDYKAMLSAIADLRKHMPHEWTFLTLSENGILLIAPSGQAFHMDAHKRSIADVSGAGDTVIATLAFAAVSGVDMFHAAAIANLAGGLVCETAGVVPVQFHKLNVEAQRLQASVYATFFVE